MAAAFGVKLARPDLPVVSVVGDGSFCFSGPQPLWTQARYKAPIMNIVLNNHSYNNERNRIWHSAARQFKTGRDMTCYLGNPDVDFAKTAQAFGVEGETVEEPGDVKAAIARGKRVIAEGRPYLLDVQILPRRDRCRLDMASALFRRRTAHAEGLSMTRIGLRLRLFGGLAALTLAAAGPALAQGGPAANLPAGEGRDVLTTACTQCHALNTVIAMRDGAGGWKRQVRNMIFRGAQVSDADFGKADRLSGGEFRSGLGASGRRQRHAGVATGGQRQGTGRSALPALP